MLNNNFVDSPTVGSGDTNTTIESLQLQIHQLEQRLATPQAQHSAYSTTDTDDDQPRNKKHKRFKLRKIRKFFTAVITPILNFVPRLLNSIARLKEAAAGFLDATTRAKNATI